MGMVFVTGGSRGIGRAICTAFARTGRDVAFCYSRDEEGARETARLIGKAGAGALPLRLDVADEAAVQAAVASLPGLEILVNNAGIAHFGQIQSTTSDIWRRIFAVNVDGAFFCTRAAIPKFLRRGGGSIVNISSVWGEAGASCEAAYSASKAALIGFTKAAAKELAPAGIRVNCVCCGMIETDMNARLTESEKAAFLSRGCSLRQGGHAGGGRRGGRVSRRTSIYDRRSTSRRRRIAVKSLFFQQTTVFFRKKFL